MDGFAPTDGKGEGNYVCTQDAATQKKAKDELGEKPKDRADQIARLRTWVKQQKHLKATRTDDQFLLRFLRRAKFSQLVAQELIDKFTTVRAKDSGEMWFRGCNLDNPKIVKMLKTGTCLALPGRDDEGRKVMIIRTGNYDPKDFDDHIRVCFMCIDILLRDEINCINGFVTILDFSEFSAGHVGCVGLETCRKLMKCWQDTYPTRNKAMHYWKTPTMFDALMKLFRMFMKEKTKQRLHFPANFESLHKHVPKRLLPEEYGGDLGPRQNVLDDWIEDIKRHQEEFKLNEVFEVDECLRPQKCVQDDGWGMTGSFRKLAVD